MSGGWLAGLTGGGVRRQLLTRIGAVLLATLILIGVLVGDRVHRLEETSWQERQREAALAAVSRVEGFLERQRIVLDALATLGSDEMQARAAAAAKILSEDPSLLEILVLSPQGEVAAHIDRGRESVLQGVFSIPQSSWFRAARQGRVYYSAVQLSPRRDPYMVLAIPTAEGGVAAARVDASALWQVVAALKFGESGRVYLLDAQGIVIAHPDFERVLARDNLSSHPQLAAFIAASETPFGATLALDGTPAMAVKMPVRGAEWTVVAELPQREYYAATRQFGLYLGLVLLAGFVLFALLTSYTLQTIILSPLSALHDGVRRIGGGDLQVRITPQRDDELGEVADTFNRMAADLAERQRIIQQQSAEAAAQAEKERARLALERYSHQLEAILRTAGSLRVNLAHEALLQTLVEGVAQALGFGAAGLAMCDPQGERLRVVAHTGLPRRLVAAVSRALEEMLPERFFQQMKRHTRWESSFFIPRGKIDWLTMTLRDAVPDACASSLEECLGGWDRHNVIVTLLEKQPGQKLGVLLLTRYHGQMPMGIETLQALEVYASLTTAALENARLFDQLEDELAAREEAEQELSQLNLELEERVAQRTAQLSQLNEELVREIEERKRAQKALAASEERYELAVRGANDGLWDWDLRSDRLYLSRRWKEMLGYDEDALDENAEAWFSLIHPDDVESVKMALANHLRGLSELFEIEYRIRHHDGSYRWVLARGLAVRRTAQDEEVGDLEQLGLPYRMAGSQTDITARKQTEEQLVHDAFHDTLTGLPNRALFVDRLTHAIARTRRTPENSYGVLFLDLDRFKVVNDSLGHSVGDELLIALAERLRQCLRGVDTAARLGGDEFVILLEDIGDTSLVTQIAERIRLEIKKPFALHEHTIHVTASIGVVLGTLGYEAADDVLRDADIALYRAKAMGKDRFAVFDPVMRSRAMLRLTMEAEIRQAIENGEFELYYQPIFALDGERISGFEALLRWVSPQHGLVMPVDFISLAEETGLIIPLGAWVLRQACRQAKTWQQAYPQDPPLAMNVNVSGVQICDEGFYEQLKSVLEETGLPPTSLRLEITESVFIENAEHAGNVMRQIAALGVQLQIDDFGTGYSSLAYLQRFPISAIKIDRSFVSSMGREGEEAATSGDLVRTVVTVARELGLQAVAEGVETAEQLEVLKTLNCPYLQGFLMAQPLPAGTAETLLRWGARLPRGEAQGGEEGAAQV
ncbi:MAG: EAL domain-containing protein [Anaerolineae bacterium]|nr:EAL domain-containing protein [Anaerolineae bacterium]